MEKCRYTAVQLSLTVWSSSLVCGTEMLAGHDLRHPTSSSVTLLQSHLNKSRCQEVEIVVFIKVLVLFLPFCRHLEHQQAEIYLILHVRWDPFSNISHVFVITDID